MNKLHCHSVERPDPQDRQPAAADDTITLDETDRHRRRLALQSDHGIGFLLELSVATLLRDGDLLRLNDGRGIRVIAKPEALYAVRGRDNTHLLHLTWHVGNRHLATQIMEGHILIRRDPVIRTMLEELGASVEELTAGFNPVGGAYEGDHDAARQHHGSPHHHDHDSLPHHDHDSPHHHDPHSRTHD